MDGLVSFGLTLLGMLRDILPIAAILFGFQILVLRRPINNPARVSMGMVFVVLGLTLFLEGLEMALFPIGRLMAEQLTAPAFINGPETGGVGTVQWLDYVWVYAFAAAIGFATALAEPALMAVATRSARARRLARSVFQRVASPSTIFGKPGRPGLSSGGK